MKIITYYFSELKKKAILLSHQHTFLSVGKTIPRGPYEEEGVKYILGRDLYGWPSDDITGFAEDAQYLAIVKRNKSINLQGSFFAHKGNKQLYQIEKTLDDDDDVSVYEFKSVDFLALFSYLHIKKSYNNNLLKNDKYKESNKHLEDSESYSTRQYIAWDTANDCPEFMTYGPVQFGAGGYADLGADVDFEMVGLSNVKIKLGLSIQALLKAEFRLNPYQELLPDINLFSKMIPLVALFTFESAYISGSVGLNFISSGVITDILLKFQNNFIYTKGFIIDVSKTFLISTEKGFSIDQSDFSIEDLPESSPQFSLTEFKKTSLNLLKSCELDCVIDLVIGLRLACEVNGFSGKVDTGLHIDAKLNPRIAVNVKFDPDKCLVPYAMIQFNPGIYFVFEISPLKILSFQLLPGYIKEFLIKEYSFDPVCLFDSKQTDEVSLSHKSSSSQTMYGINVNFYLEYDTSEKYPIHVNLMQLNSDDKVIDSTSCNIDQYTPSMNVNCRTWFVNGATEDTKFQLNSYYEVDFAFDPVFHETKTLRDWIAADISLPFSSLTGDATLHVQIDSIQIPIFEFDKLYSLPNTNINYIAFENDISKYKQYNVIEKTSTSYKIANKKFYSTTENSNSIPSQQFSWINKDSDEYVFFHVNSIVGEADSAYASYKKLNIRLILPDNTEKNYTYDTEADGFNVKSTIDLANILPYPSTKFYSTVKSTSTQKYKICFTNKGETDDSEICHDILPQNTEFSIKPAQYFRYNFILKKINPLILIQNPPSDGIIATTNAFSYSTDVKKTKSVTASAYKVIDINLETTKTYNSLDKYILCRFINYQPITTHNMYPLDVTTVYCTQSAYEEDPPNIFTLDNQNHLFLLFRAKSLNSVYSDFTFYAFFQMWNPDGMAISPSPSRSISLYSSKSYAPFFGGTISLEDSWCYIRTIDTTSSFHDYRVNIRDNEHDSYISFVFLSVPTNPATTSYQAFWYKYHYILEENALEKVIDLSSLLRWTAFSSSTSLIVYVEIQGNTKWKIKENNELFEGSSAELSLSLNAISNFDGTFHIVRLCDDNRNTMCLMTFQPSDTSALYVFKYQNRDGITLYDPDPSLNLNIGSGVYYDTFQTTGPFEFWKTWEGSLSSMIYQTYSSSSNLNVETEVTTTGNDVIISFKSNNYGNNKLLSVDSLPVSRSLIMNPQMIIQKFSLKSDAVIFQNQDGNLQFSKSYMSSNSEISLDANAVGEILGIPNSIISNPEVTIHLESISMTSDETTQNTENNQDTETTQNMDNNQNTETTQDMENNQNTETTQNMENNQNTETTQNTENTQNYQNTENAQNTEYNQNSENNQNTDYTQNSGNQETDQGENIENESNDESGQGKKNTGLIVGVIGGGVGVAAGAGIAGFLIHRKKKSQAIYENEDENEDVNVNEDEM